MNFISNYLNSLGDGWSIYLWLVAGAGIVMACAYMMVWAAKNEQFDEDIKYLIFSEGDKDKLTPEDYAKSREVLAAQEKARERVLKMHEIERQG